VTPAAARRSGVSRSRDRALGLLLGCHPLPCVAVTAFATAYAAAIGAGVQRLLAIAAAVLAGQLTVGWSNDAIDGPRDRAAGRPDKPVSAGLIDSRTLAIAALIAATVCAVLSLRLGALAGALHLLAVASAVSYNAALKATALSPLPYLISFGLLPVVVTLAVNGHGPVPPAHVVAATLLGGAAHAGNTVGDTEADAATGVRGLPQRLGPQRSLIAMAALVAVAAVVLLATFLADGSTGGWRGLLATVLLLGGVILAGAGAFRRVGVPGGRGAWRLTLLAVALVVAGFLTTV
jgi:4-hydroxybenzoate polyprenyltransferase